jgi:hypothetical protein
MCKAPAHRRDLAKDDKMDRLAALYAHLEAASGAAIMELESIQHVVIQIDPFLEVWDDCYITTHTIVGPCSEMPAHHISCPASLPSD